MAAVAAAGDHPPIPNLTTEQEVVEYLNKLRGEQSATMNRIAEAEADRHDHALVLEAIKPLEATRRCHRLVGGVLVERTVGEVLPMIEQSLANFDLLLRNLNAALVSKERELQAFIAKYKIQFKSADRQAAPSEAAASENRGGGVLA